MAIDAQLSHAYLNCHGLPSLKASSREFSSISKTGKNALQCGQNTPQYNHLVLINLGGFA